MDIFTNLRVIILSQCVHISNDHNIHIKYLKILEINHTSIKLEKKCQSHENKERVRYCHRSRLTKDA